MKKLAVNGGKRVVPEGMVKPWPWITDDDRKLVLEALEECSPWKYPLPQIEKLEKEWAEFTGTRYCLATNSGTAALHMAVAAAGVGPGDEVIVPAFTFLASASGVLHSNGIPVFVDIDPETCNIDSKKIEEKITDRTKAIMAVDIHGLPADYDEIYALAKKHDLVVIEDGSQAHGALYKGKPVGALGDMAGCSLNASKNLASACEGGLFTTNNEHHYELAERVRMFGETVEPGKPRQYNAYIMGWNYRFDNLQAAFTRSQLKRLPEMTEVRIKNGNYLTEKLKDIPGIEVPYVPEDRTHAYFFYVVRLKPKELGFDISPAVLRSVLLNVLRAEGVQVMHWQTVPVPGQSLFQFKDGYGKGCPWSCQFAGKGIEYRSEDYPESMKLIEEFLAIGHTMGGIGAPNSLDLMKLYVETFHKVLVENRRELIELCMKDE